MSLFVSIVLDGVGVGEQPDAASYGDEGSNTLGHVCAAERPDLPNLRELGLGNIVALDGVPPVDTPTASFGKMREVSAGKDSTTGHWELAGLRLESPFPTYADGFPPDVIEAFLSETGCGGVLGNRAASGTRIVAELGAEHERTGHPIVYTSADSVFQIAAHKNVISLDRLYDLCRIAREKVCVGEHGVGRVIARPFVGNEGSYTRVSPERKDFARLPDDPPIQDVLQENGVRTVSVGKIADLFARTGFDDMIKTRSNADGIHATLRQIEAARDRGDDTFLWTNLVDFDQEFGHRNNPSGFAQALEAFDAAVPDLVAALPDGAHLVLTADHGNDPTTASTDHSREYVPLLHLQKDDAPRDGIDAGNGRNLGLRASFNDHAATIADVFDVEFPTDGVSFTTATEIV
jgi:phosphopentomutase